MNSENKTIPAAPVVTAVAEPAPDGAKITKAVVEFDGAVPDITGITVRDRTVTAAETSGNTLTLHLSAADPAAEVFPQLPSFPDGPKDGSSGHEVRTVRPVRAAVKIPGLPNEVESAHSVRRVIDDFEQGEYRGIPYNLFKPKDREPGRKYPLVLFIPDRSVNGPDPLAALVQGIGATVWAEPEEQAKRPCYVLAVQIPQDLPLLGRTPEAYPALELVKDLLDKVTAENGVDTGRIYATGQSQGCMACFELNCRYPELFAASLLVSGQWDPERVGKLVNHKFFVGLSSGGPREYPGMNLILSELEKNGARISRVDLSGRDSMEACDAKVRQADAASNVIYAVFDAGTVFPDDGKVRPQILHHLRGWELTYQLESAREWIFSHRL